MLFKLIIIACLHQEVQYIYLMFINKNSCDILLVNINSEVIKSWNEFDHFKEPSFYLFHFHIPWTIALLRANLVQKRESPWLSTTGSVPGAAVAIELYWLNSHVCLISKIGNRCGSARLKNLKTQEYFCVFYWKQMFCLHVGVVAPVISWFGVTQENWSRIPGPDRAQ